MIKINPLSSSYPIKKLNNTVKNQKKQADKDQTSQNQKEEEEQTLDDSDRTTDR